MKIISKFHDYYDTVMSYGIDEEILYIRKKEVFKENYKYKLFLKKAHIYGYTDLEIKPFVIIVCNKLHLGYDLSIRIKLNEYKRCIAYNIELFTRFLKTYSNTHYEKFMVNKKSYLFSFNYNIIKNSFKEVNKIKTNICINEDCPCILVELNSFTKNPVLKEYNFFKVMNPFILHQELSMFISGVMGGKSPAMVQLKEKDRIIKQGFDKWSFRKQGKIKK